MSRLTCSAPKSLRSAVISRGAWSPVHAFRIEINRFDSIVQRIKTEAAKSEKIGSGVGLAGATAGIGLAAFGPSAALAVATVATTLRYGIDGNGHFRLVRPVSLFRRPLDIQRNDGLPFL